MKELHNHIFSNTTCISKETMLRYINKQLSKSELHEVETHMLDCELCTDAYEGMALAQNSSVIFALDNQIDQRVGKASLKTPILRNLMVAASILIIVFGTYFTVTFFNNAASNDNNLAINEVLESKEPLEEKNEKESIVISAQEDKIVEELKKESKAELIVPAPVLAEQIAADEAMDDEMEESFAEVEVVEEELIVVESVMEDEKTLDVMNAASESNKDNVAEAISYGYAEPNFDKNAEVLKKETRNVTRSKVNKKSKYKSVAAVPVMADSEVVESIVERRNQNAQKILIIDSYKIVNYMNEYQKLYDAKNELSLESNSTSAGFENKLDKEIADKEKEEIAVEVTYKETLEKAISLYKNQKYTKAITEFDVILKKHPEEVNAQFYSGLSYYNLKQYDNAKRKLDLVLVNKETEFNQEANWYKALTLIELSHVVEAKKLLKEIISENGFYKTKAEEELKKL